MVILIFILSGVVHELVAHLEKLRDEELAERREKRRKQQEEEEAKKKKTEEDGKKNESRGMSTSVGDNEAQLFCTVRRFVKVINPPVCIQRVTPYCIVIR
jgi:E3 ubiquitin-protein ligase HUWE1